MLKTYQLSCESYSGNMLILLWALCVMHSKCEDLSHNMVIAVYSLAVGLYISSDISDVLAIRGPCVELCWLCKNNFSRPQ